MKYRILDGYYCDLHELESIKTEIKGFSFDTPWYGLRQTGWLIIAKHYAWDGPSKPAIRTRNFMMGSLVHDVLYQAMREGHLPRTQRKAVDQELRRICLEQGMSKIRAWWVYHFVRIMGKRFALPEKKPRGRIVEI